MYVPTLKPLVMSAEKGLRWVWCQPGEQCGPASYNKSQWCCFAKLDWLNGTDIEDTGYFLIIACLLCWCVYNKHTTVEQAFKPLPAHTPLTGSMKVSGNQWFGWHRFGRLERRSWEPERVGRAWLRQQGGNRPPLHINRSKNTKTSNLGIVDQLDSKSSQRGGGYTFHLLEPLVGEKPVWNCRWMTDWERYTMRQLVDKSITRGFTVKVGGEEVFGIGLYKRIPVLLRLIVWNGITSLLARITMLINKWVNPCPHHNDLHLQS